mgnify:CR=1 FL=1
MAIMVEFEMNLEICGNYYAIFNTSTVYRKEYLNILLYKTFWNFININITRLLGLIMFEANSKIYIKIAGYI